MTLRNCLNLSFFPSISFALASFSCSVMPSLLFGWSFPWSAAYAEDPLECLDQARGRSGSPYGLAKSTIIREVSMKLLWKNFFATAASCSVLYPIKQNKRDFSCFFITLQSVTIPLAAKCILSLSSVMCLGMFLTINLLVACADTIDFFSFDLAAYAQGFSSFFNIISY